MFVYIYIEGRLEKKVPCFSVTKISRSFIHWKIPFVNTEWDLTHDVEFLVLHMG